MIEEKKSTLSPRSLLLGIHQYSKNLTTYDELEQFRLQIEEERIGPHHRPYHALGKKTRVYRSIYYSLALLFFGLAFLVYTQTLNWSCSLLFENFWTAKVGVCLLCLSLGTAAFSFSFLIRQEKEAVLQLIERAHQKIKQIYKRKQVENCYNNSSNYTHSQQMMYLKHSSQEALVKIQESKEIVFLLFDQISQSLDKHEVKEELYNQSILELGEKLNQIILKFKNI